MNNNPFYETVNKETLNEGKYAVYWNLTCFLNDANNVFCYMMKYQFSNYLTFIGSRFLHKFEILGCQENITELRLKKRIYIV